MTISDAHSFKLNPNLKCPSCGKKLDGAIDSEGGEIAPCEGDHSVCVYCEELLQYGIKNWVKIKIEDIEDIETKIEILRVKKLVRKMNTMRGAK